MKTIIELIERHAHKIADFFSLWVVVLRDPLAFVQTKDVDAANDQVVEHRRIATGRTDRGHDLCSGASLRGFGRGDVHNCVRR